MSDSKLLYPSRPRLRRRGSGDVSKRVLDGGQLKVQQRKVVLGRRSGSAARRHGECLPNHAVFRVRVAVRRHVTKAQSPSRQASGSRAEGLGRLRISQPVANDGECAGEHGLILRSATGMPSGERAVKREFRRLLAAGGYDRFGFMAFGTRLPPWRLQPASQ